MASINVDIKGTNVTFVSKTGMVTEYEHTNDNVYKIWIINEETSEESNITFSASSSLPIKVGHKVSVITVTSDATDRVYYFGFYNHNLNGQMSYIGKFYSSDHHAIAMLMYPKTRMSFVFALGLFFPCMMAYPAFGGNVAFFFYSAFVLSSYKAISNVLKRKSFDKEFIGAIRKLLKL